MRNRSLIVRFGVLAIAAITGGGLAPAEAASRPAATVVLNGVDNPRGLAIGEDGTLYISAVGTGGTGPCFGGPEGQVCVGLTGKVLALSEDGKVSTIARGLVSIAGQGTGQAAVGMDGVTVQDGELYGIETSGGPKLPPGLSPKLHRSAQHQLGNVLRFEPGQAASDKVADIDNYEFKFNPIDEVDSDPYAIASGPDDTLIVADAAGNTILRATQDGKVSLVAAIPDIVPGDPRHRVQSVPTGIAVGRDGNYYVSELASFAPGKARILRITPGGRISTVAGGLTTLTSIAVAEDGRPILRHRVRSW